VRMVLLVSAWAIILGGGMRSMINYEMTAGDAGSPPAAWPPAASFRQQRENPTLLVFAHPKCPCTRATISELARILTRCRSQVETHVIFLKPAEAQKGWEQTSLWNEAQAIPGVNVMGDDRGYFAQLFSVTTSGATLLYDTNGQRQFQGGITASRGHEGANAGSEAIISLLISQQISIPNEKSECPATTPVFGCPLCNRVQPKTGE
jgi:hypothetical protein